MEKVGLNITPKEFKQLSKWSENIYNTAVVIDYFVANQPEIEECYNLAPVVKHLRNDADVLNAFFIEVFCLYGFPGRGKALKVQKLYSYCLLQFGLTF